MEFKAKEFSQLTTTELYEILKARAAVFIVEQKINCQDMDDTDYRSLHCFFEEDGKVIAYLRAYHESGREGVARVGRVLSLEHGIGMGRRIMLESTPVIKSRMGCGRITMNAQKYAVGFYEKLGYEVTSGEFLEEGIVHVAMEREV